QLLRRGKSFVKFSQLLVSVGDATEGRKVTGIQFKSPLVQRNRFFVLTSAVKNPSFVRDFYRREGVEFHGSVRGGSRFLVAPHCLKVEGVSQVRACKIGIQFK